MLAESFGELVRRERERRGWDQAELAREVGLVTQQTVSRWELGTSRPRRDMVVRLAEVLELDPKPVLTAAGYRALGDRPDPALPVRPLATVLPIDELPADRFEEFIADLARRLYPGVHVTRFGGQGHTQYGFDVVGQQDGEFRVGIQCKRRKQFGKEQVRRAVKDATLEVGTAVVAITRVASPDSRVEIASHKGWLLWDKEDISREVRALPVDEGRRIVDTFFPGWREQFLGLPNPGPWLTIEEYFGDSGSAVYTHDWPMVGRTDELNGILGFLDGSGRVAQVVGRGGLGKTRLLRAVAEATEPRRVVRFLGTGSDVSATHFELLPALGAVLVIIDDAQDRADLAVVLRAIAQRNPDAKVLVSLRPYGEGPLVSALRVIGLHPTDLPRWELTDLTSDDAEALAREALSEVATDHLVRRLAHLTADCPLITVVGGVLIRRGQLDPACLDHEETVRTEILRTFRNVLVADPIRGDQELRRGILDGIAMLQPFRADNQQFQDALADLASVPYDRCVPHLRSLEDAGVVLRRGTSLRVVPDLLGDVILAEACFDDRSGTSTGYIERTWAIADPDPRQHIFVNASRVDWQIRHDHSHTPSLTEQLWDQVFEDFRASGIVGRRRLAELLRRVAEFAPKQTLDFVRLAITHPTDAVDDMNEYEQAFFELHPWTHDNVLQELPPLLRSVGYHYGQLPDALDLLWQLAQQDERETNRYPDHPMRVLRDVAELELGKPLGYNYAVVDAVERWLLEGGSNG